MDDFSRRRWHEVGLTGQPEQPKFQSSETLLSRAVEASEVIVYKPNPEEASMVLWATSIAIVPLLSRGESLGVLVIESPRGIFEPELLDWLTILSTYMTASLSLLDASERLEITRRLGGAARTTVQRSCRSSHRW